MYSAANPQPNAPGGGGGGSTISPLGTAGLDIAGGILGAIGAQQAGAASAAGYQANALSAGTTAANTNLSLNRQGQQQQYNENKLIGRQRVGYAAGGLNPASGSPLDVMGDTENQYKVEAMNRFYQGEEAGTQANQQATYDTQEAQAARSAADTLSISDILGGIGGALTAFH
jgi:hypothetical protein